MAGSWHSDFAVLGGGRSFFESALTCRLQFRHSCDSLAPAAIPGASRASRQLPRTMTPDLSPTTSSQLPRTLTPDTAGGRPRLSRTLTPEVSRQLMRQDSKNLRNVAELRLFGFSHLVVDRCADNGRNRLSPDSGFKIRFTSSLLAVGSQAWNWSVYSSFLLGLRLQLAFLVITVFCSLTRYKVLDDIRFCFLLRRRYCCGDDDCCNCCCCCCYYYHCVPLPL